MSLRPVQRVGLQFACVTEAVVKFASSSRAVGLASTEALL
jgi:hypothetical protein